MLRITHSRTEKEHDAKAKTVEQRWTLCGQLTGPWVTELRACFAHSRKVAESQVAELKVAETSHTLVDLSDVTFIDESGEILLAEMRSAGAEFVARGVDTQHLLKNLKARGERPLRRFNAPLGRSCEAFRNDSGVFRNDSGNSSTTKDEEK